jgi:hypothetical protein
VTATNVAMTLTSSALNGTSSSTSVDYTAALAATCSYSNGISGGCPLPSGAITWEFDGADVGGNVTYLSSAVTSCADVVGPATASGSCDVDWNAYGDHWLTATYSSPSAPTVAQPIEVKLAAPVDLGVVNTYSNYGNAGPGAIGDCTMAAVADWIETTLGTTPDYNATVAAYWAAEDIYNGGADVGLQPNQLFSFWSTEGIDGTFLTGETSVGSDSAIETQLSARHVLVASENLPAGFPPGEGAAGHMWIVTGYSSYGPMVVTWGQEIQLSWAAFNSWTTGVWSVSVTS